MRLFYGKPYDLLTVGGYAAWRVGGVLSIFAAVWGLLAAVRAMRAEEDAGRAELVLAGIVARRGVYLSALVAIAAGSADPVAGCRSLGLLAARPAAGRLGLSGARDPWRLCRCSWASARSPASSRRRGESAIELASAALLLSLPCCA